MMITTQFIENQSPILHFFDQIYIINLENRRDRLEETKAEFAKIGVDLSHPNIHIFKAIKPATKDGWPTIGTKGCFLSHLEILKDAKNKKYERILVLEDDVKFTNELNTALNAMMFQLNSIRWDIFYGGYRVFEEEKIKISEDYKNNLFLTKNLYLAPVNTQVQCCHFVALNKATVSSLVTYLEKITTRPAGHPAGGPMHVDGAYSWFRREHPTIQTVLAYPKLAYQRSSRTDIHDLKWFDTMPVVKSATQSIRKIKNHLVQAVDE